MGVWVGLYDGPAAGIVAFRAAIDHAARFGYRQLSPGMSLLSLQVLLDLGAYDEALEIFDRLNVPGDPMMRQTYGAEYRIYAIRGRREEALAGAAELEALAREAAARRDERDPRHRGGDLRRLGDLESACRLIEEARAIPEAARRPDHQPSYCRTWSAARATPAISSSLSGSCGR